MICQQKYFLVALISLSLNAGICSFSITSSSSSSSRSIQQQQLSSPLAPTSLATAFKTRFLTSIHATEDNNESGDDVEQQPNNEEGEESTPAVTASAAENDILNSPAFLKRKVEVLKSDIEKVNEKISEANKVYEANKAEWGPQIEDLRKEYANMQERMKQKMKEGSGTANIQIARKFIGVLENYDRAFGVVTPETEEDKEVEAAYKETYEMILKEFEAIGVRAVETVGSEFNYEFHQAVMMRPHEDYEEGIVCEELAKGYAMEDGTLIRAAMVVVAA